MQVTAWTVLAPREPMVQQTREEVPGPGEAIVEVAGCGVCHTDLGFYYEGVPTRHPFPLTLGHEVSGRVVQAGEGASGWVGKDVIVPAVIPCGNCDACRTGHGSICPRRRRPGQCPAHPKRCEAVHSGRDCRCGHDAIPGDRPQWLAKSGSGGVRGRRRRRRLRRPDRRSPGRHIGGDRHR